MRRIDYGNRVIVDELFLVIMLVILGIVVALFLFGKFIPVDKPAYIVPRSSVTLAGGHPVVSIFDAGGDPTGLNNSPKARYQAVVYIDSQSMVFRAVPSASLAVIRPGDTVYAVYTGSGFVLTNDPDDINIVSLPPGKISVRLVDPVSGLQISREDLTV